jgi:hypothetical protein
VLLVEGYLRGKWIPKASFIWLITLGSNENAGGLVSHKREEFKVKENSHRIGCAAWRMNVMKDHSSLATAESRHNYEINVYLRNGPCDQRFRGVGFASALIKMIGCRPDLPG